MPYAAQVSFALFADICNPDDRPPKTKAGLTRRLAGTTARLQGRQPLSEIPGMKQWPVFSTKCSGTRRRGKTVSRWAPTTTGGRRNAVTWQRHSQLIRHGRRPTFAVLLQRQPRGDLRQMEEPLSRSGGFGLRSMSASCSEMKRKASLNSARSAMTRSTRSRTLLDFKSDRIGFERRLDCEDPKRRCTGRARQD